MIYEYLELLAFEHPERARYIPSLGKSHEGRRIPAIEIGGFEGGSC